MLGTLTRHAGQWVSERVPATWLWQGRAVRLVDGTTVTMPDTPANQAAYPQPRSQQPGLGFPLCRLVGLVCLGSGALLNAAIGPYHGKGGDGQALLRTLVDTLQSGDLLLGDAYYATYFLLCDLQERGVDAVFEQQGARRRSTDFRRGHRLGQYDHPITITKPKIKPDWMAQAAVFANSLARELSFKHTLQIWVIWRQRGMETDHDDALSALFVLIAQQRVGDRPRTYRAKGRQTTTRTLSSTHETKTSGERENPDSWASQEA